MIPDRGTYKRLTRADQLELELELFPEGAPATSKVCTRCGETKPLDELWRADAVREFFAQEVQQ
jgi:hypothetical protein